MSDSPPSLVRIRTAKDNVMKCHSDINSSPLLKEPLKKGWKREIVYRSTVGSERRNMCDIYYFTPHGKKLRSMREVSNYLNQSNSCFSIKNFSFFKEPIGVDDNQEICRFAGTKSPWHGKQSCKASKEKHIVSIAKQNIPKHSPRKVEGNEGIKTSNILTKKRKWSCDDEKDVENQNKRRASIRKKAPQDKKQQYPIAIKTTSTKPPPTLSATRCDNMPLLTRFDDESSPACSVHDSSDEDQKKVEPLQVDHLMTLQRKKLQDPVTALKATVESLPTLRAISCDSMPVLTRFGDESSTAFSVSDSSDENQEKVEPLLGDHTKTLQRKKQQNPISAHEVTSMKQAPPLRSTSCDSMPLLTIFCDESSPAFFVHDSSDEDQEKIESLLGHHTKTSGKKQQDRIPVLKATSSKSPILRASSCDIMPLLARIEDEISPACTAHDCEDKAELSDGDQEKVELSVIQPAPVTSGLPAAEVPFPETLPLNTPPIALLPLGTTLVLSDPSTLRIIPSCTIITSKKEINISHPKTILSQPSSDKTSFRKPNASKKIQVATLSPSPSVNKRKVRRNKEPATATISVPICSPPDGFSVPSSPPVSINQGSLPEFGWLGNKNPSYWASIGKALIEEGLQKAIRSNASAKGATAPQILTCKDFFAIRKQKRKEQLNHQPEIAVRAKSEPTQYWVN